MSSQPTVMNSNEPAVLKSKPLTFINGIRGNSLLVYENFTYFNFRTSLKFVTWRCSLRSCAACVCVREGEIVKVKGSHNHDVDVEKLNRKEVSEKCKRKAVDDVCDRPVKILRTVLKENLPETFTPKDSAYVRRNMYNARQKKIPFKKPRNICEVHSVLAKMTINTCRGEPFLLVNDEEDHIVIFSCESNLQVLSRMETLFVDGTFTYCPTFFTQVFTIHGIENGNYVQLCHVLLPSKCTSTYIKFLNILTDICPLLAPSTVVVDFESAIHSAILAVWPGTQIVGCRFHLRQAWYRKIQGLGLQTDYNDMKEKGKWIRYIFGLTFLDPNEVSDAFHEDLLPIQPPCSKLDKFCEYLISQYIGNDARFPPSIWACHTASLERTTNACESFHSRYNACFYKAHPDIFLFVHHLSEFQTDTYVQIQGIHIQKQVRSNYSRCRTHVEDLIQQYGRRDITRLHFLKRCGYYMCPKPVKPTATTPQPS